MPGLRNLVSHKTLRKSLRRSLELRNHKAWPFGRLGSNPSLGVSDTFLMVIFLNNYMKKYILLALLLVLLPLASAKTSTITLQKEGSFVIDNFNFTLIDLNQKNNNAIICVNNQRFIVNEDDEKRVNGMLVTARTINAYDVEFRLEADCDDCEISDNKDCFTKKEIIVKEEPKKEVIKENITQPINETKIEKNEAHYYSFFRTLVEWVIGLFR